MAIYADGADEVECDEASMMRTTFLWLVMVGSLAACAGERRPNALVRSENYESEDGMAKNYNLVFSVIDVKTDGSGQTNVVVKLRSGNMVITNGKTSQSEVELKYRTDNPSGPTEYTSIRKLSLSSGTATFRVKLPAGNVQIQAVAELDEGGPISTESGIVEVPASPLEDNDDF